MRIAKRFLSLLLLLAVPLAAASCRPLLKEAFQSPKAHVKDVLLASNPLDDPKVPWELVLTLEVYNPNRYPLDIVRIAYAAVLGRETIADGDHRSEIRIEASQITTVKIPLTIRPEAFQEAMRQVLQARRLDYEFHGSVGVLAPVVGVVRVPFAKTGSVDALDLLRRKGFGFN
jgi:LEA14-like dessication related protein